MGGTYVYPKVYYCPTGELENFVPLGSVALENDGISAVESCVDQAQVMYSEVKRAKGSTNQFGLRRLYRQSDNSIDSISESSAGLDCGVEQESVIQLEYPGVHASGEKFAVSAVLSEKLLAESIRDLQETVNMILRFCVPEEDLERLFGSVHSGIWRQINKACNRKSVSALRNAIDSYNQVMLANRANFPATRNERLPLQLIVHILEQSYSRTVAPDADMLRHYKGFSNNVYGEIKPIFVDHFLKKVKLRPGKVFLDMGSGIGNVVLQVAAQCQCESHGIEIMQKPAQLAEKQCAEFTRRMQYYGKSCGEVSLVHGDFLENKHTLDVIAKADVILVNNYAFDAALNHSILHLFLDLKDKTKVITLKSFVAPDRRSINQRNMSDVVNIFKVTEHYFPQDRYGTTLQIFILQCYMAPPPTSDH